jgi:lysozyme family protein
MANFELAVTKTIQSEGGSEISRHPADRGGVTKYGISQAAYPQLNIERLTETQAKQIYKLDYWDRIQGDNITSQVVAEEIFDTAVLSYPKTASRLAQLALDLVPDGVFGPKTLDAINTVEPARFLMSYKLAKIARYAAICNKDKSQSVFLLGWINRTLGA